ncbi:unnamed protein product [Diamesa tonsa]
MPLQNIFGMFFPLAAAFAIGALAIGFFYRNREQDFNHQEQPRSNFRPSEGYDTSPDDFTFPRRHLDDEESNKCRICLEDMQPSHKVRTLGCCHRYHNKCIEEWLRHDNSPSCPLCRTPVL